MRKFLLICCTLAAAFVESGLRQAYATAMFVDVHRPQITFPGCGSDFKRIMESMQLTNIKGDQLGVGGSRGSAYASVICVHTPNSGVCNNGVTVVISVAGDNFQQAEALGREIKARHTARQIDCG